MSLHPENEVREFLVNRYATQFQARGLTTQIPDDLDLLKEGIIDSFGIMELVTDVECHFGYAIDFEDLDAEQMTIFGPLAAFIQRKLLEQRSGPATFQTPVVIDPSSVATPPQ